MIFGGPCSGRTYGQLIKRKHPNTPRVDFSVSIPKPRPCRRNPRFRAAFKTRRCLVITTGFYEWQVHGRSKQPMWIGLKSQRPFAFPGLWEHWQPPDGEVIESCTILTTEPNELMRPIQNRMPVMLSPTSYDQWLDPTVQHTAPLKALLRLSERRTPGLPRLYTREQPTTRHPAMS